MPRYKQASPLSHEWQEKRMSQEIEWVTPRLQEYA